MAVRAGRDGSGRGRGRAVPVGRGAGARRHPARPWPRGAPRCSWPAWPWSCWRRRAASAAYDDVLFWDHMVQHLMLIMVAPPLLIVGPADHAAAAREPESAAHLDQARAPVAGRELPDLAGLRRGGVRGRDRGRSPDRVREPVERNQTAHNAEHALFLVIGYLFFLPHPRPGADQVAAVLPGAVLSCCSCSCRWTPSPGWCSATAAATRPGLAVGPRPAWAPSPVSDLHLGGAVMWVGGDGMMFGLMMLVFLMWSRDERAASAAGWFERARQENLRPGRPGSPQLSAGPR